MATKLSTRIGDIRLNYKIWISDVNDKGILGDGKWLILKKIQEKGSLKAACDDLGYTYRRTWGDLRAIERFFGFPLLEKHRGGTEGGSTSLTPEGLKLVDAFNKFHTSVDSTIQAGFVEFLKNLQK
jgi:molybdate transport system regulatory protein